MPGPPEEEEKKVGFELEDEFNLTDNEEKEAKALALTTK